MAQARPARAGPFGSACTPVAWAAPLACAMRFAGSVPGGLETSSSTSSSSSLSHDILGGFTAGVRWPPPRLRSELRGAWDGVAAGKEAAKEDLHEAAEIETDTRRWRERLELYLTRANAEEARYAELKAKQEELFRKRDAWSAEAQEEAIAQAARSAADLARVRLEAQQNAVQCRATRRRLSEELNAERQHVERQAAALDAVAQRGAEAIGCSVQRAVALLRPRGDLVDSKNAISSTVAWLAAVDGAVRLASSAPPKAGDTSADGPLPRWPGDSLSDACEAVRGTAARLVEDWTALLRDAQVSASHVSSEKEFVEALHAVRERTGALDEEAAERRDEIAELQEAIDFENRRAQALLNEQRWLVPRVAASIEAQPCSCGRHCHSSTTVDPVRWAGFNCDTSSSARRRGCTCHLRYD
mmetsp:Transcript_51188/g.94510  ORF Transcript_51188/g.94510 Transcript_51188/m.94510 type:complete len:415 (+) Transcript_51188:3-1247(+)